MKDGFSVVTVTPQMAKGWIVEMGFNRRIRESAVEQYAEDMKVGALELNGETLKFDEKERLTDGQHRCLAVIRANKPVQMGVFKGESNGSLLTIDTGQKRTLADILKWRGEKDCNVLAASIGHLWRWEEYQTFQSNAVPEGGASCKKRPTHAEALVFLKKHPGLRESIRACDRGVPLKAVTMLNRAIGGALHFVFSGISEKDTEVFFALVNTGVGLEQGDPILALRNRLMARPSRGGRLRPHELAAYIIKAWNFWRKGEKTTFIRWTSGGAAPEPFPTPE